jgi:glutamate--cysteine ligase
MRDGEYMQLNDSLLQIENEFYSSIRPKRPAHSGETALTALHERGIEYIEVRCIDVNPFLPLGIDATTIRFLDSFMLHCLTADSPLCNEAEQAVQARNRARVVDRGREPGLELETPEGAQALTDWALQLLEATQATAALLDSAHGSADYTHAVTAQREKVQGTSELPSARMLREMHENGIPYARLALKYSRQWAEKARAQPVNEAFERVLQEESDASLERQAELDAADEPPFEEHLAAYYDQYRKIRAGL